MTFTKVAMQLESYERLCDLLVSKRLEMKEQEQVVGTIRVSKLIV